MQKCYICPVCNKLYLDVEDMRECRRTHPRAESPEVDIWKGDIMNHNAKVKAFEEAIKPLEEFVNKYCCPHDFIVIQRGNASIYQGDASIPLKLLD